MGTNVTMPPAEVLYRLAQKAKERAKQLERQTGNQNAGDQLNHIGNVYLIANEGREASK